MIKLDIAVKFRRDKEAEKVVTALNSFLDKNQYTVECVDKRTYKFTAEFIESDYRRFYFEVTIDTVKPFYIANGSKRTDYDWLWSTPTELDLINRENGWSTTGFDLNR